MIPITFANHYEEKSRLLLLGSIYSQFTENSRLRFSRYLRIFHRRSTFVLSHLLNYRHLSRLPIVPGQVACLLLSLAIISSLSVKMSFPIFSPAVQQVSLYPLGKAGCKSFSGFNGARFYLTFRYSYWGLARHHSGNGATHINCETFLVAIFNSRTTFKAGSVFSHGK